MKKGNETIEDFEAFLSQMGLDQATHGLVVLQPSQPLLRILNFSNTRVSVFPEGEEFLILSLNFGRIRFPLC